MDISASGSDSVPSTANIATPIAGKEIEASLGKKIKKRGALRGSATKLRNKVSERLEDESSPVDMFYLEDKIETIKQKIESLNKLDDEIIDLMASCDDEDVEERIEMEIEASDSVRTDLKAIVNRMEDALGQLSPTPHQQLQQQMPVQQQNLGYSSAGSSSPKITAKLPKLEVKKFSGRIQDWQEFWDSFESAIDNNKNLAAVDKFAYLRSLIVEPARSTIAGFALTSANYTAAIEVLKKRYGKEIAIQRAHVNDLLNLPPVFNDKDTPRLRKLYDGCESHFRGLKALGVDESTYSAVVVPALLNKLPEAFRLTITRGTEFLSWNMDEMLEAFSKELELREDNEHAVSASVGPRDQKQGVFRYRDSRSRGTAGNTTLHTRQEMENCAFCLGKHAHENCRKVTDVSVRKNILVKFARCFKCLQKGHRARDCELSELCKSCGQSSHHTSICDKKVRPVVNEVEVVSDANPTSASPHIFHVGAGGRVALQTACAVISGEGKPQKVRVLFDAGSHRSFVTARIAQLAQLPMSRQDLLAISTFGQSSRDVKLRDVVHVKVSALGGEKVFNVEAYVVPEISTIENNHVEFAKFDYPHLRGLWFSDVSKRGDEMVIDVLIGADYLWNFQKGCTIRGRCDEPVAVETELGWVLSGPMKGQDACSGSQSAQVNFISSTLEKQESLEDVRRLWDLETLGIRDSGDEVHESFENNISFNGTRYSVRLPWKVGHPELPSNYSTSLHRLRTQLQKLERDPEILQEYAAIMEDQLQSGIIEKVIALEKAPRVHYLPHQAVVRKESATTKVRVVYDASSREGKVGACLNDCLHVGPPLTPLLYNILLRFRENRVILVGDIQRAFLNVEVDVEDRDCLRFLWVANPPDLSQVVEYRFCRVVFGLNASPFLLNATLRHHITKYEDCDPRFVSRLLNSFYVDDFVGGGGTSEEVVELYHKVQSRMSQGGFRLRKWLTNDAQVRAEIETDTPLENKQHPVSEEDTTYAKSLMCMKLGCKDQKVLGCEWDYDADVITLELTVIAKRAKGLPITKRNTLKLLAGVFDPLGLISPVTVSAKVLFQKACRLKISWDDQLDGDIRKGVEAWIKSLVDCQRIVIKRCVYDHIREEVVECWLHGFADASKTAYCGMVYFVYRTSVGRYVRMLTSKTRVAPLKELSTPRLELMAALILVKLVVSVEAAFASQANVKRSKLWSDSKTALFWIGNRGEWKQFVKHRVNEILKVSGKGDWRYCPSCENPADIGSRGATALDLKHSDLWWKGPSWLVESEDNWPAETLLLPTTESQAEQKKASVTIVQADLSPGLGTIVEIAKYSCVRMLLRVTAWIKRFCFNACKRTKSERKCGPLSSNELAQAEIEWIKAAQRELKQQGNYAQLVHKFGLSEDTKGVLRCKGRMDYSDLPTEAKEPVILPREHRLTYLQIQRCHMKVLHCGVKSTLAELRSKFWVPKGRQVVKKVLSQCVTCKKLEGRPFAKPATSNLPEFRVNPAPPFSKVGVDFAGPLLVKGRGRHLKKAYVALFSCCVTRALHLDLVEDLSTPTFLRCLRKFTARRGTPTLVVSDNARTFKAAERELRALFRHPEVRAELANRGIEWRFNLARAPWWGGFFERMVQSVKQCLRKVLGNARLSFDEMLTVLVEVEGTLNSRPLTYDEDNPTEEVLTPSHLIYGRRIQSLPEVQEEEEEFGEDRKAYTRRYKYLGKKLHHFWKRWQREYLLALRERHEGRTASKGRSAKVGDVVIVHEDGVKRGNWRMGVVDGLICGRDSEVRGAHVRVTTGGRLLNLTRPVQKLYPIEVHAEPNADTRTDRARLQTTRPEVRSRPRRAAALDATWKTRCMVNQPNN